MDYQKRPICLSCSQVLTESHAALPLETINSADSFGHFGSLLGCMFNPGILMNPPSRVRVDLVIKVSELFARFEFFKAEMAQRSKCCSNESMKCKSLKHLE